MELPFPWLRVGGGAVGGPCKEGRGSICAFKRNKGRIRKRKNFF